MFEQFTIQAKEVVVGARGHARRLDHQHIGTEHLLLGLCNAPATISARLLAEKGLTTAMAERGLTGMAGDDSTYLDADALGSIGIDLEAVRDRVEATLGQGALDPPIERGANRRIRGGHLPLTRRAKKVLELAFREAIRLHHRSIGDQHLLLALIREEAGLGAMVLVAAGIDLKQLRAELDQQFPPDAAAASAS